MTRRDIEKLIRDSFDVIVEPRRSGNRYWIKQNQAYYPITSAQFDNLLEGGYVDPDYRVEHDLKYGSQQMIYTGR